MAKKKFKIRAKLVFSGYFTVQASSKQEQRRQSKKNAAVCSAAYNLLTRILIGSLILTGIVLNKNREQEGLL